MKKIVEFTIERVHCNLCFPFSLKNIMKKYYPKNELEILVIRVFNRHIVNCFDLEVLFDLAFLFFYALEK